SRMGQVFQLLALGALLAADAPVSSVTVYSDRARVTRTATVSVSGTQKIELPLLNEKADASSIRVEAQGADVARVDIERLEDDQLPADEARKLLDQLDKLDDDLARVRAEAAAYSAPPQPLERLSPSSAS